MIRRLLRAVGQAALFVCLMLLALVLIEGASSVLLLGRELASAAPVTERQHTRYDPDLGWSHRPGVAIPDLYGPGLFLHTNAQGFRGSADVAPQVAPGHVRVVCSGDSFTLGYGVDDDHTWCALVAAQDPRFETVNMGQGGYGLDQAYLWYQRDGQRLAHQIHVLAFITEDFGRMARDEYIGYAKPLLRVQDGVLVQRSVPVPQRPLSTWLTHYAGAIAGLRTTQLVRGRAPVVTEPPPVPQHDTRGVVAAIFADLQREHRAAGRRFLLVYLPTRRDYVGNRSKEWRQFVRDTAQDNGIAFVDLIDEMKKLAPDEVEESFRLDHYSEKGNAFVASHVLARLRSLE